MTTTAPPSLAGLVDGLVAEGVLPEPWRAAFLAVPREVFIPEVIWHYAGDYLVPLHRGEEPHEWLRRAYGPHFDYQPNTHHWPVQQFGPRRLFDEVTAAYQRWNHTGQPPATQWRFTVTPDGQCVELAPTTPATSIHRP